MLNSRIHHQFSSWQTSSLAIHFVSVLLLYAVDICNGALNTKKFTLHLYGCEMQDELKWGGDGMEVGSGMGIEIGTGIVGWEWQWEWGWLPLLTWQFVICAGCCCDWLVFRISFSVPASQHPVECVEESVANVLALVLLLWRWLHLDYGII